MTAALLSSCGVYKNYERPSSITADGIYGDAQSGGEQGLGDLGWRQVFTDPTLQALIEQALAQNSNLRQADLRIQEAQNNLKAAKLAFFPSLAFAPSGTISGAVDPYNRDEYKAVMGNGANKTYSFPLALNWQIDCFGQLRNTKKGREVAVENMKTVRQAVQTALHQLHPREQDVLYELYFGQKKIDDLAKEMHYCVRQIHRLHKKGLHHLQKILAQMMPGLQPSELKGNLI